MIAVMDREVLDQVLLGEMPDYMTVGVMLKAKPAEDGGRRYVYLEASNEDVDHQNEIVLQKALKDSTDYYLRHGNIDLSHITMIGAKAGVPNYLDYEIGRPVAVHVDGKRTFLKGELYRGTSAMARNADTVWDSMTKQDPPARWYASVGGAILRKSVRVDGKTQGRVAVAEAVRWNNTALDRCPVNKTVGEASLAPIGTFAKSMGGFVIAKTLTAGYGTDSATMTGGRALAKQSLDRRVKNYFEIREHLSGAIRANKLKKADAQTMTEYCVHEHGCSHDEAAEHVGRFIGDLKSELKRSNKV